MSQLKLISFTRLTCAASLKRMRKASSTIVQTPNDLHGSIQYNLYSEHSQVRQPRLMKYLLPQTPGDNIFSKTKHYFRFHLITKYIYRARGALLYRHTADNIDHIQFIKDFRMPDTYYSWFLITELHVWMLMVRLVAGGSAGLEVRKYLITAMWEDADARRKKLGANRSSIVAPHMELLGHQFNAAVIGYDEGLMGNDQVLAGALWRRFFQSECNNPELIEKLIAYVRRNINMLDDLPVIELISKAQANFIHRDQCWSKNSVDLK